MGRWIAEPTLCWREPSWAVRLRLEEERKAFPHRLWILFIPVFMIVRWAVGEHSLDWTTPAARLEHLQTLLFGLVYGALPWVFLKVDPHLPCFVCVTDHGIRRRTAWMLRKDIDRCELDVRDVDGRRCAWLDVILKNGQRFSAAVGKEVSLRRVEEALRTQGFPVVRHPSARNY